MNKYLKHFITVIRHKYYVAQGCFKLGIYWQGITHDISKFSLTEFVESAKYFHGSKSPIEVAKESNGYSDAWLSHKGRNRHHWQYWIDFNHGTVVPIDIPIRYLMEMAADIVGASKAYLVESLIHQNH